MISKRWVLGVVCLLSFAAAALAGDIDTKWREVGAATLGEPSAAAKEVSPGVWMRPFGKGAIYSSSKSGTHAIHGAAYRKYKELGAEKSALGLPVTDISTLADGSTQIVLQHGWIDVKKDGTVAVQTVPSVTFTEDGAKLGKGSGARGLSQTEALLLLPTTTAAGDTTILCSCRSIGNCDVNIRGDVITCRRGDCGSGCRISIVQN